MRASDDLEDELLMTDRPFAVNKDLPVRCEEAAGIEKATKSAEGVYGRDAA